MKLAIATQSHTAVTALQCLANATATLAPIGGPVPPQPSLAPYTKPHLDMMNRIACERLTSN